MRGDFSRQTFDPKNHYNGVLMQQGRVQVDADWNEQQAIGQHRDETTTGDVVGPHGAPKEGGGFKIGVAGSGQDLTLSAGRLYVQGILCQNEDADLLLTAQPDLPPRSGALPGFELPTAAGRYLAYLDVWPRHITALEDPALREIALGGPDTTTRAKTVWQVRLLPVGATDACATFGAGWAPPQAAQSGRLKARVRPEDAASGPCVLPPDAGYRRLENQLYRVEIHTGGAPGTATFKWSRDNGTVTAGIEKLDALNVTVHDVGRDDVLGLDENQLVEVVDDRDELTGQPGELIEIDRVNRATRIVTLKTAPAAVDAARHPKLRRWEGTGPVTAPAGPDDWIALEGGLQVQFTAGTYRTGDYWLIPARTATSAGGGDILWPRDASGEPRLAPPHGVPHAYCPLGLVDFDGTGFTQPGGADCRPLFPALTALTAADVSFDPAICELPGATTVQAALDALCRQKRDGCPLTAVPGPGWETVFDRIGDEEDAHVCFQVGDYPLEQTVTIRGKGHLRLSGCGAGTRILAAGTEAALRFEACRSVDVRHVHAESSVTGAGENLTQHLNGVLTFVNCLDVTVEHASVRCAAGAMRAAACLTVENRRAGVPLATELGAVRVRHCRLAVGHQQTGLLLLNVRRAQVEDNDLSVPERPAFLSTDRLIRTNKYYRAGLRKLLVGGLSASSGAAAEEPGAAGRAAGRSRAVFRRPNANVTVAGRALRLATPSPLSGRWQALIDAAPPERVGSTREAMKYVNKLADQLLLGRLDVESARPFRAWLDAVLAANPAIASQGIVVGGREAQDVRILNNTIGGTLQGIHVGVSHRENTEGAPDRAGVVTISGNTVEVGLSPALARERHGIFVGNCDTLAVQNNYVRVVRHPGSETMRIEGIRIFGHLGLMMVARENHLVNCTVGIYVEPLAPFPTRSVQWLVANTMAPGTQQPVLAPGLVRKTDNFA